ncbi:exo-beta-N-acetylmuramidase NamZ domain-containing protein [Psychroserpens sp.]|uniref:exo-beta-N-acetylmuramidase NamZ domain-containing protein n=1 Tax=Psychroserpens sp. TaxID=2020870 RepID=UPI003C7611B7
MFKNRVFPIIIGFVLVLISCGNKTKDDTARSQSKEQSAKPTKSDLTQKDIVVGANRVEAYISLLKGKRVGVVANQTSVIFKQHNKTTEHNGYTHLVDSILKLGVDIKKVFAPEHGFRGTADAGELIKDGIDTKTQLPILSLHGKNKKPSSSQLADLDVVIFDIQDVGARFYTYISSLHYVMEACAESSIPLLILDRPNPNGHYVDGPILEPQYKSFVGMHPVPVVHGMTIGEYAQMINGEGWLDHKQTCDITVITMTNYKHTSTYQVPIKPSPNLPNDQSINLYPSLCFFEGTNVNAGRGTSKQFQIYGSPYLDKTVYNFKYIPSPNEGAKYPKHDGILCYGEDLSDHAAMDGIDLGYVIRAYQNSIDKKVFFNDFFTTLAGTTQLQTQIESGVSQEDIKMSWANGLSRFKMTRSKYLIYE